MTFETDQCLLLLALVAGVSWLIQRPYVVHQEILYHVHPNTTNPQEYCVVDPLTLGRFMERKSGPVLRIDPHLYKTYSTGETRHERLGSANFNWCVDPPPNARP